MSASVTPFFFGRLNSNRLLLSNQTGAFHIAEESTVESLVQDKPTNLDNLERLELEAKGFIVPSAIAEEALSHHAHTLAKRYQIASRHTPYFIVVPTLRCDHNCSYCQVSRAHIHATQYDMSERTIAATVDHILTSTRRDQAFKVEFQGGEPLLAFESVRAIILGISALRNQASFVVCSALGPLNSSLLQELRRLDTHLSVSLDGPETTHEPNRGLPKKKLNHDVSAAIRTVLDQFGHSAISCLATVTRRSLEDPIGIADLYYELGLDSLYVRPISPYGFASLPDPTLDYSAGEFGTFYRKLLDRVVELNQRRLFVEENALIHLQKIFQPEASGFIDLQTPASYALGVRVIDYDGSIFGSDESRMLYRTTKEAALCLGNVCNGEPNFASSPATINLLKDTFIAASPGCDLCVYQPYCGSDPLHHLATQGDPVGNKAKSTFCAYQRTIFGILFELLDEAGVHAEVFSRWLALRG